LWIVAQITLRARRLLTCTRYARNSENERSLRSSRVARAHRRVNRISRQPPSGVKRPRLFASFTDRPTIKIEVSFVMLFYRVRPRLTRHGVPRDRRSPLNTEGSKIIAVDYLKKHSTSKFSGSRERRFSIVGLAAAGLVLCLFLCGLPTQALAQSGQTPASGTAAAGTPKPPATAAPSAAGQQAGQQTPGGIRGTVADQAGNLWSERLCALPAKVNPQPRTW